MTTFTAEVFQNEYLPAGGTTVDAVVTVTADGAAGAGTTEAVEIIILDRSGSMNEEGGAKIRAARQATASAIEQIRDGVWFAVVGGNNVAEVLYPPGNVGIVQASAQTKAQATDVVSRIEAHEGTAIGSWLSLASQLFALKPQAIHHAILLTDGKNQHETAHQLESAISQCVGRFQCDCRGLGTDWNVEELRKVATSLLGSVDIIPRPDDMDAAFRGLMEAAMGKAVGDVRLRMWAPQGSRVEFVRQVAPSIDDMTPRAAPVNQLTADFPLGAWANAESRDYHLRVQIPPGNIGDERLAARVMLMVGDQQVSSGLVKAIWTTDEALSTRIDRQVAHYTGQAELAEAIADGLAAREAGDEATATVRLGRAVQLAQASGNDDTVKLLAEVVEVDNAETGTVRLKRDVDKATAMTLDTRSTRTVRVKGPGSS